MSTNPKPGPYPSRTISAEFDTLLSIMIATINRDGLTVEASNGDMVAHPLLARLTSVASAASQHRNYRKPWLPTGSTENRG